MNETAVEVSARVDGPGASVLSLTLGQRLGMLALNYIPLLQAVIVVLIAFVPWQTSGWRLLASAATLYLAPPLIGRILLWVRPVSEGRVGIGSRDYFTWWALANLQMIFCRLSFLEELIRLVPGLYSAWLRLWGARVGSLTYWGAGLRILDRSFLQVGNHVIFGAAVRLNAHVMAKNKAGETELMIASIEIGDGALIGGYSLLTAGTQIAPGECTRAFLVSPPFSKWKGGTRVSKAGPGT